VAENVQEGDKMIDSDSIEYSVVAVNKQDFGMNTHLEIIMKQYDE